MLKQMKWNIDKKYKKFKHVLFKAFDKFEQIASQCNVHDSTFSERKPVILYY